MAVTAKSILKSTFQTGDTPSSAQFSDLIDSIIQVPLSGDSHKAGIVEIISSAESTAHTAGAFGRSFLAVNTTAAARDFLAVTSASGPGGGAVGQEILNANTTASVTNQLGILPVATLPDASAAAQGVIQVATTAQVSARAADIAVTPSNMIGSPLVVKAWAKITWAAGVPSVTQGFNVAAPTDNGVGDVTVNWSGAFADANYSVVATVFDAGSNAVAQAIAQAAGSVQLSIYNPTTGGSLDPTSVFIMAIGPQ